MEKFLGKDLLKELCKDQLPTIGQVWPCCPRLVFSLKLKFTKDDWYDQVKKFNYRLTPVDNSSLFHVANSWGPNYGKEAATYGLAYLKELHKQYITGKPDDINMKDYIVTIIKKVRIAIRKYGSTLQKREFIAEILLIQSTIKNMQDDNIKSSYDDFLTVLKKMDKIK